MYIYKFFLIYLFFKCIYVFCLYARTLCEFGACGGAQIPGSGPTEGRVSSCGWWDLNWKVFALALQEQQVLLSHRASSPAPAREIFIRAIAVELLPS